MTSQGPQVNGIDARCWISAGYACHMHGGEEEAWIEPVYERREDVSAPVRNITDGTVIGFRYLQFGQNSPKRLTILTQADGKCSISVRLDAPGGKEIARFSSGNGEKGIPLRSGVTGKHAVYFVFGLESGKAVMDRFTFDD